jgi:excisionase family DNA binding protein
MTERKAFTVKEFRQQFDLCKNLAYKLIETGQVKSIRAGRKILIPAWAVEEFLKKNAE